MAGDVVTCYQRLQLFLATSMAQHVPTSRQKYQIFVATETAGDVPTSCQKKNVFCGHKHVKNKKNVPRHKLGQRRPDFPSK